MDFSPTEAENAVSRFLHFQRFITVENGGTSMCRTQAVEITLFFNSLLGFAEVAQSMPELPEVETTRRGVAPFVEGNRVRGVTVRCQRLRRPVPKQLSEVLTGKVVQAVGRRAKYLLFEFECGTLLMHLGMSGHLRVVPSDAPPRPHDHLDLVFDGHCLRFHDPRRFGLVEWTREAPNDHPLLRNLGPEPLGAVFGGEWLHQQSRGRRVAVKSFIMDQKIVVGVGNIYANEALFRAGIHPGRAAGRISLARYRQLADAIREVLTQAIAAGGTTLKDFTRSDGRPGYFSQSLAVYGRAGQPCLRCGTPIRQQRQGQRSTWYCPRCQH